MVQTSACSRVVRACRLGIKASKNHRTNTQPTSSLKMATRQNSGDYCALRLKVNNPVRSLFVRAATWSCLWPQQNGEVLLTNVSSRHRG